MSKANQGLQVFFAFRYQYNVVCVKQNAEHALTKAGYKFVKEEVLYVELKNRPGALAKAVEKLAKAKIDVRYAYATAYTKAQKTGAVLAVNGDDLEKAVRMFR